ncbi:hypothetical protein Q9L42_007990 [Methylomarinum sp. Ch1-1]|uniref:Ferritin n=1 Tax=Methylomarinum roseum TaxID=3067653 RepID=A0AAU7NYR9_9GAMM|nr:hypothetical protein [Methylomarinum sp. Ch1-1]MDP4521839.1 hypothetical protein [Methylomarinum sp. Ch1-1]
MNKLAIERMNFIDMLNEEFLSVTGYGAYAFLSTFEGVDLFDRFSEQQSQPANLFIRSFVRNFYA